MCIRDRFRQIVGPGPLRQWREKAAKDAADRPFVAAGSAYSASQSLTRLPSMNDLRLKPFDFNAAVARAGLRPDGMPRTPGPEAAEGGSFRTAMADALKEVSQTQFQAQRLQRELTLDNPTVSVEETMMAMQKAQLGFQATLQVRNRLVQARCV